jgi:hypothetical protein
MKSKCIDARIDDDAEKQIIIEKLRDVFPDLEFRPMDYQWHPRGLFNNRVYGYKKTGFLSRVDMFYLEWGHICVWRDYLSNMNDIKAHIFNHGKENDEKYVEAFEKIDFVKKIILEK